MTRLVLICTISLTSVSSIWPYCRLTDMDCDSLYVRAIIISPLELMQFTPTISTSMSLRFEQMASTSRSVTPSIERKTRSLALWETIWAVLCVVKFPKMASWRRWGKFFSMASTPASVILQFRNDRLVSFVMNLQIPQACQSLKLHDQNFSSKRRQRCSIFPISMMNSSQLFLLNYIPQKLKEVTRLENEDSSFIVGRVLKNLAKVAGKGRLSSYSSEGSIDSRVAIFIMNSWSIPKVLNFLKFPSSDQNISALSMLWCWKNSTLFGLAGKCQL